QLVLTGEQLGERTVTVVSQPQLASQLGIQPAQTTSSTFVAPPTAAPIFTSPAEQQVAQAAYEVIRTLESQPQTVPSVIYLQRPEVQAQVAQQVASQIRPSQLQLPGVEAEV